MSHSIQPIPIDTVHGDLIALSAPDQATLIVTEEPIRIGDRIIDSAPVILHYGFAYLHKPQHILPQFVFDDFQREHHGRDALNFMLTSGDRFPRADVIGTNVQTGKTVELYMKEIDLAQSLYAFGSAKPKDGITLARISDVLRIIPARDATHDDDTHPLAPLPEFLRSAVPCKAIPIEQAATIDVLDESPEASQIEH